MHSGILLVDKPSGVSSHGVVSLARKALGTKKIGHAGTLDPAATGLLVLGVNAGTRLLTFMVGLDKTYVATLRLAYSTTTDDAEGERIDHPGGSLAACTPDALDAVMAHYRGEISQVPSTYSAIKVEGKRAYDLARRGHEVELAPRAVTVHRLTRGPLKSGDSWIDVDVTIECSSGTYIRALARDIGAQLGVGGHLVALRRTEVGPFSVEAACTLEGIEAGAIVELAPAASAVMASVELSAREVDDVRHGKTVACEGWPEATPLAALARDTGQLVAIVEARAGRSRILMGVAHTA